MSMEGKNEPQLSKAQQRVIDALNERYAYLVPPIDSPGKRTGYVTTGGIRGYICPVTLATLNVLVKRNLISGDYHSGYKLV